MIDYEIKGLKESIGHYKKLGKAVSNQNILNSLRAGALIVQNGAKQRAPYLTGTLRRSIHIEDVAGGLAVEIGTDVVYARRIEMGYRGPDSLGRMFSQAPQPYLRPALFESEAEIIDVILSTFKHLMDS